MRRPPCWPSGFCVTLPLSDQTVYKEMRDLFGIDFTRFRVKNAADGPAD